MPKLTSKSRQELRSRFVRNAIPTEADFADLIAASLNQADDGVLKLPDQPLGLVRQKQDQPVLRFFADPAAEGSAWQLQLGDGDKPGFGLAGADGKLALFVDGATGNVGIGVGAKKPEAALHIAGNLKVEAGSIKLDSNQKVFFMDNGQIGGRDQYHQLLFRCTENITELREWGSIWLTAGNETCNNKPQIVVSQAEVKIGARLRISENNGTAANEVFGSLLLDHEDAGGASSIVFRSKADQGSDYSFIEYKDQNPATQGVGASLLTIGNRNDSNDHIALMPSGNVGIGTTTPGFRLTIQGDLNATTDPESRLKYGGMLGIKSFAPQIDFIDTDRGNQWAIHVNESRMYFVREPWENEDLVLDGKGNIGMGCIDPQGKLNIRERTGTPASALKGTLLLDHEDAGGASSIVFRSKADQGSDYSFIEYKDQNPDTQGVGASLLTIGNRNDSNDHIALMPSGNVGIGTTTPGFKLDVNGDASISDGGSLLVLKGKEIFFSDNGQIRSLDNNHRILFRRDENKMELREYGDIIFSSGSTGGQETSRMVINRAGKVGVGTATPLGSLHVIVPDSGVFFEFPGKGTWVFQSDGNLVKYRADGSVAWALNNGW
jgi:hypothetical protein